MSTDKPKRILVPRITQLDANEFDGEMSKILFNQLMEIGNILTPGTLSNLKPEITFLLNLIIFKYSIIKNRSTFGQDLLGLKYDESLKGFKIFLYPILKYFLPYLQAKYEDNMGRVETMKIMNLARKLELVIRFGSLLNMFIFLKEGKFPTLTDRLLGLKYTPTENFNRTVGYSLMMRQLLWHGFMELLTNITPLMSFKVIGRKLKMLLLRNSNENKIKTYAKHVANGKCVICKDSPILPCIISTYCPHIACYYCIRSNTLEDEKFMCPECNEPNTVSDKPIFL